MRLGLVLALFLAAPLSWAHGGGLNKCGCHFNRKTGQCHCHQQRGCGCECQPANCSAGHVERTEPRGEERARERRR